MRWSCVLLALCLVPACGKCGASGKQEPIEQVKAKAKAETAGTRFRAALVAARAAEVKQDWPPAIAAYGDAVKLGGDQAVAYEGLARTQFRAGQLDQALDTTTQGIDVAIDPKLQGSLFALHGQVLDARGDRAGALRALRRSILIWPTPQVAKLFGKVAGKPPSEQLSPSVAAGPYKAPGDYCAELARAAPPAPGWTCTGELDPRLVGPTKAPAGAAPFGEVRVFDEGAAVKNCLLGVELADGWYVAELHRACVSKAALLEMVDLSTVAPEKGGTPFLYVKFTVRSKWREIASDGTDVAVDNAGTYVVLCGVGASKALACTPHVPTHTDRTLHGVAGDTSGSFDITFKLGANMQVGLATDHKGQLDPELRDLIGVHTLVWP